MAGKTNPALKQFVAAIKKKFRPERVLLFGSRARGEALESSDYDLLIVADSFQKYSFTERISKALELLKKPLGVDIVCLTPREFSEKTKQLGTVREAARQGIPL
ncbi:MAG: nucleotidyltransferase domain-containing protein [Candidatus Micrarchaeota archaeon]